MTTLQTLQAKREALDKEIYALQATERDIRSQRVLRALAVKTDRVKRIENLRRHLETLLVVQLKNNELIDDTLEELETLLDIE